MEPGAIFDVYQDGKETFRGLQTSRGIIDLTALVKDGDIKFILDVDFDNEVDDILTPNILKD